MESRTENVSGWEGVSIACMGKLRYCTETTWSYNVSLSLKGGLGQVVAAQGYCEGGIKETRQPELIGRGKAGSWGG